MTTRKDKIKIAVGSATVIAGMALAVGLFAPQVNPPQEPQSSLKPARAVSIRQDIGKHEVEVSKVYVEDGAVIIEASAWKNGKQIGFSKDGSVDIERFKFYDLDLANDIDPTNNLKLRGELLKQLDDTISSTFNKPPENIKEGKVGSTVSTFYPDANPESTSVDGYVARNADGDWNTIRTSTGDLVNDDSTETTVISIVDITSEWSHMRRGVFLFDSSALPDTDIISSTVFSFYVTSKLNDHTSSVGIISSNPNTDITLINGDYLTLGTTRFASDIAISAISTGAYKDWTLNANGIAAVSKTSITKLGMRIASDIDNSEPTKVGGTSRIGGYFADNGSNEPKLVVTHAVPAVSWTPKTIIF